uniref:Uncharacterized protein n=1 Tax=Globodera rostochiensis TaxID=31243 RepID=A0A914IBT7_GLORO
MHRGASLGVRFENGPKRSARQSKFIKIKMHLLKNDLDVGLVTYPPPPRGMEMNKNAGRQHNTEELLDDMTKLWTYQMMIHPVDDNANENARNGKDLHYFWSVPKNQSDQYSIQQNAKHKRHPIK